MSQRLVDAKPVIHNVSHREKLTHYTAGQEEFIKYSAGTLLAISNMDVAVWMITT